MPAVWLALLQVSGTSIWCKLRHPKCFGRLPLPSVQAMVKGFAPHRTCLAATLSS